MFYIFIYNHDSNNSNKVNTIQISQEQNKDRLNIITKKFHEPIISSLYKVHYTGIKSFRWTLLEYDKLQMLNQIISHYPIEKYEEANSFILEELKIIVNNTHSITLKNYKYLSLIHNKFKEQIFLEKESIITELARNLSYIDEVNDF
ncbi:hypothetical protein [Hymenobacter perfusus]|uniref:Uncharacterized protein n=1 Tax=Hymenobacter perfusus TaxID=1236770 RepID=A0A428K1F6_9BACT|nr:hypothetical protein [Hymenobacter perfusus]RSK40176.1 hypothetical protein EI293_19600 [Hymenobacter perfusus]